MVIKTTTNRYLLRPGLANKERAVWCVYYGDGGSAGLWDCALDFKKIIVQLKTSNFLRWECWGDK